ncbi:Parvovirus coat protein VP1-like protein [Radiobacillus kanasensis]|uniref:Parvovirus coat protein VP1-like protein n=1 Tax=Radiobacillus kanasensis TaxID=2844358 RepID=UPI001E3B86BC|nr:Parvovirus coat protein VP1-like protein [Radiobacillus kanasensis]UFU00599.1 Parvovirus coat protein VP1-like protein [Radiobacillus kanasensis]
MACFGKYRYCGPNCTGPGAPINELDSICREHDLCYRTYGHKYCDQNFLRRVGPLGKRRSRLGRDARLMYRAIQLKSKFF